MVLTAAQTTAFFRNEDQMGIPQETFPRLANEGIVTVAEMRLGVPVCLSVL